MTRFLSRLHPLWPALALAVAVLILYWPAVGYDYFLLDDKFYTVNNPYVLQGLSWKSVVDILTTVNQAYWIPVTWLSFLFDIHFFGMDPAAFHRTNIILFALNVLVCYWFIHRATASAWVAFAVAALFAFHPMRVESVVWISERKDVLSGLFFFVTMTCYLDYARSGKIRSYVFALLAMLAGMASKPILLVVAPLMLLLDFWPLGRIGSYAGRPPETALFLKLLKEKLPFFLLAGGFAIFTFALQQNAMTYFDYVPWYTRIAEAAAIHLRYLQKIFLPIGLALGSQDTFRPPGLPEMWIGWALFLAVGYGVLRLRARYPWLAVGWFWYIVAIFPVNGLFRAGFQVTSDRFVFLPVIGISLAVVWTARHITASSPMGRRAAVTALCVALVALAASTRAYMSHWKDSVAIYKRSLDILGESVDAHAAIGEAYFQRGDYESGIAELSKALALSPNEPVIFFNLATANAKLGRDAEAEKYFLKVIKLKPNSTLPRFNYAILLADNGRVEEARTQLRYILALDPGNVPAGEVLRLLDEGRWGEEPEYYKNKPTPRSGKAD